MSLRGVGEVRVVFTDKGQWFVNKNEKAETEFIEAFPAWEYGSAKGVYTEKDEWPAMYNKDDPVLHIELRDWGDILVVAPLTANTMAKIANGFCDNLLTSIIRAWEPDKPMVAAPAMNTTMLKNPITINHLNTLTKSGIIVVPTQTKKLACGEFGDGAMADVEDICGVIKNLFNTDSTSFEISHHNFYTR
jgi:phosphopantothenoylcysteine decarboxylase